MEKPITFDREQVKTALKEFLNENPAVIKEALIEFFEEKIALFESYEEGFREIF